jgi:hypothetical protein
MLFNIFFGPVSFFLMEGQGAVDFMSFSANFCNSVTPPYGAFF